MERDSNALPQRDDDQAAESISERAAIVKENLPFVDTATAREVAADQLHVGKINPTSRSVDDERALQAQDETPVDKR